MGWKLVVKMITAINKSSGAFLAQRIQCFEVSALSIHVCSGSRLTNHILQLTGNIPTLL